MKITELKEKLYILCKKKIMINNLDSKIIKENEKMKLWNIG